MKLICLSSNPSKPCFVLRFKGITIMLDCGLDLSQLLHFLPIPVVPGSQSSKVRRQWTPTSTKSLVQGDVELKECGGKCFIDGALEFAIPETDLVDLSQVDAILVSNYGTMLALPFITEYTGFQGTVYATEPTLQMGRQYMEELVEYVERSPHLSVANAWRQPAMAKLIPPPVRDAVKPLSWRQCYTRLDIDKSLSRVQLVGFNEKMNIYGSLKVIACSSGYCLGSCNWIIQSEYEKVCYVSASSTFTSHSVELDKEPLKNSDVLILSCLAQAPQANPDDMIGEFVMQTASTVRDGGNVLLPVYPCGAVFDMMEMLSSYLITNGLSQIPMYFLSPVSDSTLAYSNIFGEWLSQGKQSRIYMPEAPFPHAEFASQGRLKNYRSIHRGLQKDFKQPCIVFAGHPSLRMGDVVHFMELWSKSASNLVIFTEPDFPYNEYLVAPFSPLNMRVSHLPLDTCLRFSQANKLIRELRPLHLVTAERYIRPPADALHRTDLVIDWEIAPLTYKQGSVLSLPVKRSLERVDLDPALAASLVPVEIRPGAAIAVVTATMEVKNNCCTLKPLPGDQSQAGPSASKRYIFGIPNIESFVEALKQEGISSIKTEDTEKGHIIHLPNDETLIVVEGDSTHIFCEGDETIRIKVRDTLLKCLRQL